MVLIIYLVYRLKSRFLFPRSDALSIVSCSILNFDSHIKCPEKGISVLFQQCASTVAFDNAIVLFFAASALQSHDFLRAFFCFCQLHYCPDNAFFEQILLGLTAAMSTNVNICFQEYGNRHSSHGFYIKYSIQFSSTSSSFIFHGLTWNEPKQWRELQH